MVTFRSLLVLWATWTRALGFMYDTDVVAMLRDGNRRILLEALKMRLTTVMICALEGDIFIVRKEQS